MRIEPNMILCAAKVRSRHDLDAENEYGTDKIPGKGLILLLHGAPGVGKTSTAGEFRREISREQASQLLTLWQNVLQSGSRSHSSRSPVGIWAPLLMKLNRRWRRTSLSLTNGVVFYSLTRPTCSSRGEPATTLREMAWWQVSPFIHDSSTASWPVQGLLVILLTPPQSSSGSSSTTPASCS